MATRKPVPTGETATNSEQVVIVMGNDFQSKLRDYNRRHKMGRPKLDPDQFMEELVERLCSGESLLSVCADSHMPSYEWVMKLAAKDSALYSRIDRCRALGVEAIFDSIQDIASGGEFSTGDVTRDRLLVEVLTRYVKMRNPARFGDRMIPDGGVVIIARPSADDGLSGLLG